MVDDPAAVVLRDPPEFTKAHRRLWQGIPGIERTSGGRYYATWYSGERTEEPGNFVVLATRGPAEDDTWHEPILVVMPPTPEHRAYDPCLWHDPLGRLWLFWAQSCGGQHDGRAGVWAIRCDCPEDPAAEWTTPRRLANGVMMNKPIVASSGDWLMPAAVWACRGPYLDEMAAERFSNVLRSTDQGETWALLGGADIPNRGFDEHMVVELRDGRLWMLVRTRTGIGGAFSGDGGRTWETMPSEPFTGPNSRFFIRRLSSGALLLVNHVDTTKRENLAALLSDDDGKTWPYRLMLDEREKVSYPDGVQDESGRIDLIYDYDRFGDREILMASITETDIRAGNITDPGSRLQMVINRATGSPEQTSC